MSADEDDLRAATEKLEAALGHRFSDRSLLRTALQHSSYVHDRSPETGQGPALVESNERLEFLGDSVIGLVVADALFASKPDWAEGDLTRALHALVEGRSLAALAKRLEVGPALRLGRTEQRSGGREKKSILADAMEALIGAIYLDGGIEAVRALVDRVFGASLAADAPPVARDPKTELQERTMARVGAFPSYALLNDSEVEGDDERFEVEVRLEGEVLASGIGRTKRSAQRAAAVEALRRDEAEPAGED